MSTGSFIEVDIDAFQLQVRLAPVASCRVYTMLVLYHLPELSAHTAHN